jgi:dihydrodipicolinate synthase/N-acetylneuraminate lyase
MIAGGGRNAPKLTRTDTRWGLIRGNWATLLLPIADDDSVDLDRLEREIAYLIAAGVDGIYSNGTAGEFCNQTEAEFDAIQDCLAEPCLRAAMPFVIGACHPDPRISLGRVRRAARLTPTGIQVILPDWWPVSEEEAIDFLAMAADAASGLPLVLYMPPHSKRVFAPETLAAILSQAPTVVGVKLGDGDAHWYEDARRWLDDVAVYVPGHHLATGVAESVAVGAFSNVACLSPAGAQRWTRMMADDLEGALAIEARLRRFMDDRVRPFGQQRGYSNAALDKLLAAAGGWADIGTRLRRPYRWIDPAEVPPLHLAVRKAIPELFN